MGAGGFGQVRVQVRRVVGMDGNRWCKGDIHYCQKPLETHLWLNQERHRKTFLLSILHLRRPFKGWFHEKGHNKNRWYSSLHTGRQACLCSVIIIIIFLGGGVLKHCVICWRYHINKLFVFTLLPFFKLERELFFNECIISDSSNFTHYAPAPKGIHSTLQALNLEVTSLICDAPEELFGLQSSGGLQWAF